MVLAQKGPLGPVYDAGGSVDLGALEPKKHSPVRRGIGVPVRVWPGAGPVVVTRNGKAVAVLVGVEDDEEVERLLLAHSRKLRAILDAADRRIDAGAGIGHDEFWQQVEAANRARVKNGQGKKRPTKR